MENQSPIIQPNSDGGTTVYLQQAEIDASKMPNTSEILNIVEILKSVNEDIYPSYYNEVTKYNGKRILDEMGQVVWEEFMIDHNSRKDWVDNAIKDMKLFSSYMGTKTFPWKNCSNVSLPMMTTAVLQFQARAYEALIPAKNIVSVLNTEKSEFVSNEKISRIERVQRHMNYQLMYEMEEFEEDMDKLLMEVPIIGTSFKKTYYDPGLGRNVSGFRSGLEVVINYGAKNIESAHRVSDLIFLYPNDIRKRVIANVFDKENAWNLQSGRYSQDIQAIHSEIDKYSGVSAPSQGVLPRLFIEQHREWDLNGDGVAEPFIITIDYETRKVVRIVDRRYRDASGKEQTLNHFTKYGFIPNPHGFYDIGFGTLMRGLNESANTIVNEVIDAGSLANLQGGFVSKRSGIKKGQLAFSMGEYKEVDTYMDDIRKAMLTLEFKGPNGTLYSVLGLLYEYSKLVASVSETMTGQLPASDTPASTVLALLEEGRKVFSSIHKRMHRAFKKELRKLFRLNSIFIDAQKYFNILGENGTVTQEQLLIARSDYLDSYDVIPVSDPVITSKAEKIMKAEKILQTILSNPLSSQNNEAIYNATFNFLDSFDTPNINEIYPKPQPQEPQDISAVDENVLFLSNKNSQVLPQQDHNNHLTIHNELLVGVFKDSIQPDGKIMLEQHIQEHFGQAYKQSKMIQQSPQGVQ